MPVCLCGDDGLLGRDDDDDDLFSLEAVMGSKFLPSCPNGPRGCNSSP